eukprot:TRINITY_DN1908_c0_g1_i1.p1 TRINITY_DN1908_c0_g1~~TRINITY_DN1908_c0_g1_i1.p1  ORF type:complete len:571 (-),score=73.73 TRINITY_DN1908_c0_g1_i1:110-1822(-)
MAGIVALANSAIIFALNSILRIPLVEAGTFLSKQHGSMPSMVLSSEDLGSMFLAEIENVLGSDHTASIERRLAPMEVMLRPTLSALPRDEQGRYGHKSVQYALHRLFVKKHGWYLMLLSGESSPGSTLADNLPEYLQGLFEARLGSHGLVAHEVALLAAALENLVHREAMTRLDQAYEVEGISANASGMSVEQADSLIDTYMAMGILGESGESLRRKSRYPRQRLITSIEYRYDGWPAVRTFAREVREESSGDRTEFAYADVLDVVERIADRYGRWQNRECDALKSQLLSIEEEEYNGRVTLAKFYNASLEDRVPFNESRDFLRQLGALDETQKDTPRLLVSNYVLSLANCLSESAYYTQCCINECENFLEHLERELASPDAEPDRIAALIPGLSSTFTPAKQTLQPKLLQRLHSIADGKTGRVLLHSRSFAQWLHHVFPRECPYPHVWGGSRPMGRVSYIKATGLPVETSLKEMRAVVENSVRGLSSSSSPETWDELSLWSHEEELYAHVSPRVEESAKRPSRARRVAVLAAFLAMVVLVGQKTHTLTSEKSSTSDHCDMFASSKAKMV